MPAAPRPEGKAKKIAFKLLGKPENRFNKKNARDKYIDRMLLFNDTRLVR